jgi:hypothetical protein
MTRFYDIDAANAALPEVREIATQLAGHRLELILLRDRLLELQSEQAPGPGSPEGERPGSEASHGRGDDSGKTPDGEPLGRSDVAVADETRLRLRMQGIIDQMQASVARLEELSITLRDIKTGLVDFPALVTGRQVCLCWRLGEESVDWWHELTEGYSGRRPLSELA